LGHEVQDCLEIGPGKLHEAATVRRLGLAVNTPIGEWAAPGCWSIVTAMTASRQMSVPNRGG
jgi:hypothetical protein